MTSWLARSPSRSSNNTAQSYEDHISEVKHYSLESLERLRGYFPEKRFSLYRRVLNNSALVHDYGKLSPVNQQALREDSQKRLPLNHKMAGSYCLWTRAADSSYSAESMLVYGHHSPGLANRNLFTNYQNFQLCKALGLPGFLKPGDMDALNDYLDHQDQYPSIFLDELEENTGDEYFLSNSISLKILLSILINADHLSASDSSMSSPFDPRWEERVEHLNQYVQEIKGPETKWNTIRKLLYSECSAAECDLPFMLCNAPVGSGKTTAVLAQLLKIAVKKNLRRIIYIAPYTNILTQTADIFRKALVLPDENPDEIIAEIHHLADVSDDRKSFVENWNAPIIVTTAVAFFETLSSRKPGVLKKLMNLPGSALFIDEYHDAFPDKLARITYHWLDELAYEWCCPVCFSSGTSYKIWEIRPDYFPHLKEGTVFNLISDSLRSEINRIQEKRVDFDNDLHRFVKAEELASFMEDLDGSKLVICSTRYTAASLACYLRRKGLEIYHLSTALTPADRKKTLNQVIERLMENDSRNVILVATSCVECGLNLSFHHCLVESRSVESVIQASGRTRRNFEDSMSNASVHVFRFDGKQLQTGKGQYFSESRKILEKCLRNKELNYENLDRLLEEGKDFDYWSRIGNESEEKDFINFETVDREYHIIEEKDDRTFTPDIQLFNDFSSHSLNRNLWREYQMNTVKIPAGFLPASKRDLIDDELNFLDSDEYDSFIGIMKLVLGSAYE